MENPSELADQAIAFPQIDAADDPARAVDSILGTFGPRTLFAIHPATGQTQAFYLDTSTRNVGINWVRSHNCSRVGMNIYFHLNPTPVGFKRKAADADIISLVVVGQGDIDVKGDRSWDDCWGAILTLPLQPSFTIMTGGGFQIGFLLADALEPTNDNATWAEALSRHIETLTGGDAVHNRGRIFRVPFTMNWPNERKRQDGRVPCPSGLVLGSPRRPYTLDELRAAFTITVVSPKVVQFPGSPLAVLANRSSNSLTAAAQANLPGHWFDGLSRQQKNGMLRALAAHPPFVKLADQGHDQWLPLYAAFHDASERGADEADSIAFDWCRTSQLCNEANIQATWKGFSAARASRSTVGTLIKRGEEVGFCFDSWRQQTTSASTTVVDDSTPPIPFSAIPTKQTPAAALSLMNSVCTYVHNWGGEPLVAHRQSDDSWRGLTEDQLKRSLSNRRVVIPASGEDGKERAIPLATWWLNHHDRREVDKVIFDPTGNRAASGLVLNLWTGLARQPVKGCCRLIVRHLLDVICDRDRTCYHYVLRWLAHAVQCPGSAPGTVLVLRSDVEGAGKSFLLEIMYRIFGKHAILLNTPEELTGRFNDHLETVCFVGLNEPAFPGDHRQAGKLKSMITDSTWLIEGKYRGARRVPNIAHIAMTTNREWAVPAGNKARRFLVLDVNQERAGDRQYFNALWHEVGHGGIEAFLHVLLRIPVSGSDLRDVPRTAALRRQQLQSADTMTRWAADAVKSELVLPVGSMQQQSPDGFGSRQPTRALYASYTSWCAGMHQRPASKVEFGRWLSRCGFARTHTRHGEAWDIPDRRSFGAAVFQQAGIV